MSATRKILKSSLAALFLLANLLPLTSSKLRLERPDPLVSVFRDTKGEIEAQYANFGHIPYGQTLVSISRKYLSANISDSSFCKISNNRNLWLGTSILDLCF